MKSKKIQFSNKKVLIFLLILVAIAVLVCLELTNSNYKLSGLIKESIIKINKDESIEVGASSSEYTSTIINVDNLQSNYYARHDVTIKKVKAEEKAISNGKTISINNSNATKYTVYKGGESKGEVYNYKQNIKGGIVNKSHYVSTSGEGIYYIKNSNGKILSTITIDKQLPKFTSTPTVKEEKNSDYVTVCGYAKDSGNSGIDSFGYTDGSHRATSLAKYEEEGKIYFLHKAKRKTDSYPMTYVVYDKAGNSNTVEVTIPALEETSKTGTGSIKVTSSGATSSDTTKPTISEFKNLNGISWAKESVTLQGTASDNVGLKGYMFSTNENLNVSACDWNIFENVRGKWTATQEVTEKGTWYFYVADNSGNWIRSNGITVNIDKTSPEITVGTISDTSYTKGSKSVKITVKDTESGLNKYAVTQESLSALTNWKNFSKTSEETVEIKLESNGTYYFYAEDKAGNISSKEIKVSSIDNTKPVITKFAVSTTKLTTSVDVDIQLYDGESGLSGYQFIQSSTPSSSWKSISGKIYKAPAQTVTENGTYYLHVKDEVGNIKSRSIIVTNIVGDTPKENAYLLNVDGKSGTIYVNQNFVPTTSSTKIRKVVLKDASGEVIEGYWLGLEANKDLDKDEYPEINAWDARAAFRWSCSLEDEPVQEYSGDVNGDGELTVEDSNWILKESVDLKSIYTDFKNRKKLLPAIIKEGSYKLELKELLSEVTEDHSEDYKNMTYNFVLDKTKPEVDLSAVWNGNNIVVTVTAQDELSGIVKYQFTDMKPDENKWKTINATTKKITEEYTVSSESELNDLYFYVEDKAGNRTSVNILNMSDIIMEEDSSTTSGDDESPEIVSFKYLGTSINNNTLTVRFAVRATDNEKITGYQINKSNNVKVSDDGYISYDSEDGKVLEKEINKELNCKTATVSSINEDDKEYFYITDTENNKYYKIPNYYFYVKDNNGNYSVMRLFNEEGKDTQRPQILYVEKTNKEKKNSEILKIYATDFENGSGLNGVSVTQTKGECSWEQTKPGGVSDYTYTKEITENGTWYVYVKDVEGNISLAHVVEVTGLIDRVKNGDVSIGYDENKLVIGEKISPTITEKKDKIEYSAIIYESNKPSIATVDSSGVVTGKDVGKVDITAKIINFDGSCVEIKNELIVLDREIKIVQQPTNYENIIVKNEVKSEETIATYTLRTAQATSNEKTETVLERVRDDTKVTISCEVTGTNLKYQWYECDNIEGENPQLLKGKTESTLTIVFDEIDTTKKHYYYCQVTNNSKENNGDIGSAIANSDVMTLTVWTIPNTPTISVVDKYNNVIESGKYSNTEINITCDTSKKVEGIGELGCKYSYDQENWYPYEGTFKFDEETEFDEETRGVQKLYVKSCNAENKVVESDIKTFDIIIDKENPSVVITSNVPNVTNKDEIELTFTWNEWIEGFEISDINLNNASIKEGETLRAITNTYSYKLLITTNTAKGNVEDVTITVEEGKCVDKVGKSNVRTETKIKVDKQAPILIGLEAYADSNIKLNSDIDTVKQYYKEGDTITVVATFSENIDDTIPALRLQFSDSGDAKGTLESKIEGNKIIYTYEITDGDKGTLSVKDFFGRVKDIAGNETIVTKRTLEGKEIIADATNVTAPMLEELKVVSPNSGKYNAGDVVKVEAVYNKEIYVLDDNEIKFLDTENAPTLKIKFGDNGEKREATVEGYGKTEEGKVDRTKIIYTYTIVEERTEKVLKENKYVETTYPGDNGKLTVVSYENKKGVEVCDIAGNVAKLNTKLVGNEIIADTIAPKVENVWAEVKNPIIQNTNEYYKAGNIATIYVRFNEKIEKVSENSIITVMGNSIKCDGILEDGETAKFTYTIETGDNGYLRVNVPGSQFKDMAGNENVQEYISEDTVKTWNCNDVYADTTAPTVTLNRDTVINQTNQTITISANFSESIYDLNENTVVTLSKDKAPKLIYSFGSGANKEVSASNVSGSVITYNIEKDPEKDNGTLYYELAKGNLCDRAGNEYYKETSDTTAPELEDVYITSDSTYGEYCKKGVNIKVIAKFNEEISNQIMELKFKIGQGSEQTISGNIDNEDKTKILFNYQVKDGDNGEFKILDVQGNTSDDEKLTDKTYGYVKDSYGNQKNIFNFDGKTIKGSAIADTIKPYIAKVEAKVNNKVIASYTKENGKDAITKVGKTNASEIEYVVTFSELVNYKGGIQIYNGDIKEITYNDTDKDGYYTQVTIKAQPTIEGVQSLMIPDNTFEDRAGNGNIIERFNIVTTDFTKPTIRFISEYNGGTYVIPTNIGKVEIRPNVEISEDIAKIEYKWDEDEYTEINDYSTSSDIAVPAKAFTEAGTHTLYIRVIDLAENVSETSKTYEIKASNIKVTLSTEEWTNKDITVTVEFGEGLTDNRKVTFKSEKTGETVQLNTIGTDENGNTQYTITENGVVYAEATDKVGNKVFTERAITNIDKEAPTVEIDLNSADLVIGTEKEKATIKTDVTVKDNKVLDYSKFAYIQKDIDIANISSEDKSLITTELMNDEAKIENAESTKDKTPYYLYVIAKDKAGNEKIAKAGPFTVLDINEREKVIEATETTPETKETILAEISNLIAFEQKEKNIYITYNERIKEKQIKLSQGEDGSIDYEDYDYVDVNKPTTITVIGKDACGNEVIVTKKVTREMIEGPEFEVYGNPEEWTNQDVKLEVYCSEELSALTVNETNILNNMFYVVTENGDYKFVAKDIYENSTEKTIKVTKIDKDNPIITKAEASGKTITITAEDATSGIAKYAITDTTEVPVEWSDSKEIKVTQDGIFYAWVMDNAGNITKSEDVVTVDTTAPTITFNYTKIIVTVGEKISATIVTDEDAIISYSWDNKDWNESEEYLSKVNITKEATEIGTYTLYAKATDKYGNETGIETVEFTVIKNLEEPSIIIYDLPTMKVNGQNYVKISADMITNDITDKMDKDALHEVSPDYTNLTQDGKLKTGSEIKLNGETKYIVIVNGDVNCDGKVGPIDVTYANSIRLGKVNANTIQKLAADFDLDGSIKPIDITMINSYRLGKIKGI